MSEPRGLAGAVLSIRSPRPLSATQRPGTLPWEAARAPTPCGRASRRIWGPPHPCTLSQVRDSRAQPLTTPSGQGPGDHQGDPLPSGPELPGGATRRPLQLMSWCPGCPPGSALEGGALRCRRWGPPLQPQVRSLGNHFLQAHLWAGEGGGGSNVHTYPVAPPQAPASRSPRQPAGPQTAGVREGQGGEVVLGTAMANLESSLSHGELRPSAPDASECVGRGSGTEPSRGSRSSPGPPRPPEPAHSLIPGPPTFNALCIQLLLLSRFSHVRLCVTP